MFGSFLPSALGWFGSHQSLLGYRSRHCHGINLVGAAHHILPARFGGNEKRSHAESCRIRRPLQCDVFLRCEFWVRVASQDKKRVGREGYASHWEETSRLKRLPSP